MGIYVRGNTVWMRYRDIDGTWRNASTTYRIGEEARAQQALEEVELRIAAQRTPSQAATGCMTNLRDYAEKWQLGRDDIVTRKDDQSRLDNHILPALGHIPLAELRPRHIRDFIEALQRKKKLGNLRKDGTRVECEELIAPRTVLHVYGTLRSMLTMRSPMS
jgi:hypothetical protein